MGSKRKAHEKAKPKAPKRERVMVLEAGSGKRRWIWRDKA